MCCLAWWLLAVSEHDPADIRYAHMLQLVGPSSNVCFTSLSAPSIPPLQSYLTAKPAGSKAVLATAPVLSFLDAQTPPIPQARVCLLDPRAERVIAPEDAQTFDVFLYGGILGDDPPRDRTGELRRLGFEGRHLGPVQMTTDTALGVTKMVVEDGSESRGERGVGGPRQSCRYSRQATTSWPSWLNCTSDKLTPVPLDKIPFTVCPASTSGSSDPLGYHLAQPSILAALRCCS